MTPARRPGSTAWTLAVLVVAARLGGCASTLPAPSPSEVRMAVGYDVSPGSVLITLSEAADVVFGPDGVSRSLDGFIATRGGVRTSDILIVRVDSTSDGSVATFESSQVSWPTNAFESAPFEILQVASELGVSGRLLGQVRAELPHGECRWSGAWETEVTDLPDPDASGSEVRQPELIGGLEGVQQRVAYPEADRRAGIQGVSIVRFVVDERGSITCAETVTDLPGSLDEAALAAVVASEFTPGTVDGEPVPVRFMLPISFRLR